MKTLIVLEGTSKSTEELKSTIHRLKGFLSALDIDYRFFAYWESGKPRASFFINHHFDGNGTWFARILHYCNEKYTNRLYWLVYDFENWQLHKGKRTGGLWESISLSDRITPDGMRLIFTKTASPNIPPATIADLSNFMNLNASCHD